MDAMPKKVPLPVVVANADTATFDCIFGRGCEGICCKNGRPSVTPEEQAAIRGVLDRALPHLRPEARKLIEAEGFISNRTKLGHPMLRVSEGWCVFFSAGCVLHKVGAEDGDAYQYKPTQCALFPVEQDDDGSWFVRQWGLRGEKWDLFCLNPKQSKRPAVESLAAELVLAAKLDAEGVGERSDKPVE
jgi:Fe-S-cluster containining protein